MTSKNPLPMKERVKIPRQRMPEQPPGSVAETSPR